MTTPVWICIAVVLVAAITDVATRRIPNLVTLGGIAVGLAVHAAIGLVDGGVAGSARAVGAALLGAVACGLLPFVAWKKGEMGGGDVKLFAAIGAIVGPATGFDVQARTFAISLLVIFPYRLIRHGALVVAWRNVRIGLANLVRAKDARVPYAEGPKLPPVVLGPTIGLALLLTLVQHGVIR